jgi:hypothetical protein
MRPTLSKPVLADEHGVDAAMVLLAGPSGLTARLSDALKACAEWPQGVHLVDLSEQVVAPSMTEAQRLVRWRAKAQSDSAYLCTLLATHTQGCAADLASTQAWRLALSEASWPHAVLHGDEAVQLEAALAVILHAWARWQRGPEQAPTRKWRWVCEDCDDGDCEQHWLPGAGQRAP